MHRVTLITPNYNHARFLPEYFESILAYSRRPDEIILIDDGSVDNSVDVVKSYQDRIPELVLLKNECNKGLHFSINYGIDRAKYDLVAISAVDDILLPHFFEKCLLLFDKYPDLGLVFANSLVFQDKKPYYFHKIKYCPYNVPRIFTPDELVEICKKNPAFTITSNSCLYKKEVLLNCNKHDSELLSLSDFYLSVQICFRHRIGHVPEFLAAFRFVNDSYGNSVRFNFKKRWQLLSSMMSKIWAWENLQERKRLVDSGYLAWMGYFLILYLIFHPTYWRYLLLAVCQVIKYKFEIRKLKIPKK